MIIAERRQYLIERLRKIAKEHENSPDLSEVFEVLAADLEARRDPATLAARPTKANGRYREV